MASKRVISLFTTASLLAVTSASRAQAPLKIVLQIHKVVCLDETNSGRLIGEHGKDNMVLGGVTIAPNGRTAQIKTIKIGSFESDGKQKTFSPPLQFASIAVTKGKQRQYSTVLVLAEQDVSGGTNDFVAKLLNETNATSGDDGKSDGGASAVLGEVAKEVAKELLKRGVARLKQNAPDDIFVPHATTTELREADLRFPNGKTSTVPQVLLFSGHGGKYTLTVSWKLVS